MTNKAHKVYTLRSLYGGAIELTFSEVIRLLRHPAFITFVQLCALSFTLFDAHGWGAYLNLVTLYFYWSISVWMLVLCLFGGLILVNIISNGRWRWMTFSHFIIAISMVPVVYLNRTILLIFITEYPGSASDRLLHESGINFLMAEVFSVFFFKYVFPQIGELFARNEITEPAETRYCIQIGGEGYDLTSIQYVRSNDHYLKIVRHDESSELVYGRLADLLIQVEPSDALTPHRSFWVPRTSIAGKQKGEKGPELLLISGATLPIARSQKKKVDEWLETHLH